MERDDPAASAQPDERAEADEPDGPRVTMDVPEADAVEQATEWAEAERAPESPSIPMDVPEADAVEQTLPGVDDDPEEPR